MVVITGLTAAFTGLVGVQYEAQNTSPNDFSACRNNREI